MKQLNVRLSDDDYDAIVARAQEAGLSISGLVRTLLDPLMPDPDTEKLVEEKDREIAELERALSAARKRPEPAALTELPRKGERVSYPRSAYRALSGDEIIGNMTQKRRDEILDRIPKSRARD